MTHTSTEQPEALRLANEIDANYFDVTVQCCATELRRQHARILELEAAQAGRFPLTFAQYDDLLSGLRARMGRKPLSDDISLLRAIEAAHGITQEKQG